MEGGSFGGAGGHLERLMIPADKIGQLTAGATRGEGIERVMTFRCACISEVVRQSVSTSPFSDFQLINDNQ